MISLGAANALYFLRRPYAIKLGKDEFSYIQKALEHFTVSTYLEINSEIRNDEYDARTREGKYYDSDFDDFYYAATGRRRGSPSNDVQQYHYVRAKQAFESLLRSMLTEYYFRRKTARRVSLTICIALALVGYGFLAIPSIDLFLKVMIVILKPLFA
jgi:hypothetical protein